MAITPQNPFDNLVWYSVCSRHREYVTGCAACQHGYWADAEPEEA